MGLLLSKLESEFRLGFAAPFLLDGAPSSGALSLLEDRKNPLLPRRSLTGDSACRVLVTEDDLISGGVLGIGKRYPYP